MEEEEKGPCKHCGPEHTSVCLPQGPAKIMYGKHPLFNSKREGPHRASLLENINLSRLTQWPLSDSEVQSPFRHPGGLPMIVSPMVDVG